jgi:hypothetical protein
LSFIQNKPGKAPLTRIAKNFNPESLQGCGSVDSIKNYNDKKYVLSVGIIIKDKQIIKLLRILNIKKLINILLK